VFRVDAIHNQSNGTSNLENLEMIRDLQGLLAISTISNKVTQSVDIQ